MLPIVYQPQAIFRTRPVNRRSATIAGVIVVSFLYQSYCVDNLGRCFCLTTVMSDGNVAFCLLLYWFRVTSAGHLQ